MTASGIDSGAELPREERRALSPVGIDGTAGTLAYFAIFHAERGQGIRQKITGFINAARQEGWATRAVLLTTLGVGTHLRLGRAIASAREDVLVIRSTAHHLAFLLPFCLAARRHARLVLDVPTPHAAGVYELWHSTAPLGTRVRKLLLLIVGGPVAMWPFHRILQYAAEGRWWMLGNRGRTLEIGNGIDLQVTRMRHESPSWPAPALKLVAVANVSFWHGYDRLLRAMRLRLDAAGSRTPVELTIIGAGEALPELQALVRELDLQNYVTFTGPLYGDALHAAYCRHHVGVASLALHRKKLSRAAELKVREYCAVGIPFIAGGDDPDFSHEADFRFSVSQSESVEDVAAVLDYICGLAALPAADDIRAYACSHLDAVLKFRQIIAPPRP